jgi:hypothetical protein
MRIGFYLRAGALFGATAILASSAAHARPHHHGLHAEHLARPDVSAPPANHVAPTGTLKPEDHGVADTDDAFTKAARNAGRPGQPGPAKSASDGTLGAIKDANTGGSVKDTTPPDVHMKDLGPVDTGISAEPRPHSTKPGTVRSAKTKFKVVPGHGPQAHPRLAPATVVRNAIGVPIHPQGTDNKSGQEKMPDHLGAGGAPKPSAGNGGTGVVGLGLRPQVPNIVTTNRGGSPTPAIPAINHSSIGGSIALRPTTAPGVIGGPAKNVVGALNGTTFRQRHP